MEGLELHLDEVGWQVGTAGRAGYQGRENVPVTDEVTQAAIYAQLIMEAACDPDIASLSFFGYRDDGLRTGFQAGLARVDGSARPSAGAVRDAIAASACTGEPRVWSPGSDVLGTKVDVGGQVDAVTARLAAGEDAPRGSAFGRPASSSRAQRCRVGRPSGAALAERRAPSAPRSHAPRGGHGAVRGRGEPDPARHSSSAERLLQR